MSRLPGLIAGLLGLLCLAGLRTAAQSPAESGTAELRQVRSEGQKVLSEAQIAALSGLQPGAQVGRSELQAAADKLLSSGLFSNVKYDFKTRPDGVLDLSRGGI